MNRDYGNELDENSKKQQEYRQLLDTAIGKQFELKKELLEISEVIRKGKFNMARLRDEKDILTRAFWSVKNR